MLTAQANSDQRLNPKKIRLSILPQSLRGLSDDAQRRIREKSYVLPLKKGQSLLRAGDIFDDVIIVLSGWLTGEIDGVNVLLLAANEAFCVYAGENQRPSSCTVKAVTNCDILVIQQEVLWEAVAERPRIMINVFDKLIANVERLRIDAARRGREPLELRLAAFLWDLGIPVGDGTRRIPSVIPQAGIASYLGASREEVSRKKSLLVKSGYLFKKGTEWFIESVPTMGVDG